LKLKMKRIRWLVFCAMLSPLLSVLGQDSLPRKDAPPAPNAASTPAPANPTPTPIPTGPLGLIPAPLPPPATERGSPPAAPELPDLSQLDQVFKQTTPGKEVEEYRAHVEWRELKSRTANDPAVVAAKTAAGVATTDLEKRNRLRAYYEIYYARMIALASTPQMVDYLNKAKTTHLDLLAQPRVRPTPEAAKKAEH